MSIQSDLQALEQHAGVIDPHRIVDVNFVESEDCPGGGPTVFTSQNWHGIAPAFALDIRTGQAMRWLMAWCEDNGRSFRLSHSPLMVAEYRIEVRGGGGCVIFNGGSVAVVLAAAIADLRKEEEA